MGADVVATGHYARVERSAGGALALRRGLDPGKDQSYFLFSLTQEQLARVVFPVGEMTKPDVRAHARALGLRVADKPDSQEICFVPDSDYAGFVERQVPAAVKAGVVADEGGRALAPHDGVHRFTIGQRKGLGVSAPVPLYVLRIDADSGQVTVGPRDALERRSLTASQVMLDVGEPPDGVARGRARRSATATAPPRRVRALPDGRAAFESDKPLSAWPPARPRCSTTATSSSAAAGLTESDGST